MNIYHSVTFLKIFLHVLISEASKYNMCKFYQIASNSLQVIQIVHELFDCPSYVCLVSCLSVYPVCVCVRACGRACMHVYLYVRLIS